MFSKSDIEISELMDSHTPLDEVGGGARAMRSAKFWFSVRQTLSSTDFIRFQYYTSILANPAKLSKEDFEHQSIMVANIVLWADHSTHGIGPSDVNYLDHQKLELSQFEADDVMQYAILYDWMKFGTQYIMPFVSNPKILLCFFLDGSKDLRFGRFLNPSEDYQRKVMDWCISSGHEENCGVCLYYRHPIDDMMSMVLERITNREVAAFFHSEAKQEKTRLWLIMKYSGIDLVAIRREMLIEYPDDKIVSEWQ